MVKPACAASVSGLLLAVVFWGASGICYASTQYIEDSLWIRVNGQVIRVTFDGNWTDYPNGDTDCTNGDHRTANGNRIFLPMHISNTPSRQLA